MASLLYANDAPGTYPDSQYHASAPVVPARAGLTGDVTADICIVGAGYTGLSAALHLAEAGFMVTVLEAQRVGWGASGRNGGQLGSGQRVEQPELEQQFGREDARMLWTIAEEAKATARRLIADHDIDCDLKTGIIHSNHRRRYDAESAEYVDHMNAHYDCALEYLPPDVHRDIVRSPRYSAGVLDPDSGHLHPLKYTLGLARAAEAAGVTIHEGSEVLQVTPGPRPKVGTASGTVTADHVILAGNGYLEGISDPVARHVMPINNFVIATQPLSPDRKSAILSRDVAVCDSKFVVNYFRLSADDRLIFGGRESYGYHFPKDIKGFVRKAMVEIFPQTRDLRVDYGWGGTLAITMNRLPFLRRTDSTIWNASGYSGHGVAMATMSGRILAEAITGQMTRFDAMAKIPTPKFPGGPRMRHPLLVLAMLWYGLRDRL